MTKKVGNILTRLFEKVDKSNCEAVRNARVVDASLVKDEGEESGKEKNIDKKG